MSGQSLIAAAPDLYAALEAAIVRVPHKYECMVSRPTSEWAEHGSWNFDGCVCEIRPALAALAKARGEPA